MPSKPPKPRSPSTPPQTTPDTRARLKTPQNAKLRFFLDGHSRIYVDLDGSCKDHHSGKPVPLFHVLRNQGTRAVSAFLVRCPKSLSPQERSRLKEKP